MSSGGHTGFQSVDLSYGYFQGWENVCFHVQAVVGLAQVLAVGPIDPYYVCLYSIYTTGFRK